MPNAEQLRAQFPELTFNPNANTQSSLANVQVPEQTRDEVKIRDFTIKQKVIPFTIDDDRFEATAILGLPLMQELVRVSRDLGDMMKKQDFSALSDIFAQLLTPESAPRFIERLNSAGPDGLDVKRQVMPILFFLMEEYGLRPTQPSSDSLTGSPSGTDGTPSTDGSSHATSTSET